MDHRKVLLHRGDAEGRRHGGRSLAAAAGDVSSGDLGAPPAAVVEKWIDDFAERLAAALGREQRPAEWTPEQLADVERRRPRYAGAEWTQRR